MMRHPFVRSLVLAVVGVILSTFAAFGTLFLLFWWASGFAPYYGANFWAIVFTAPAIPASLFLGLWYLILKLRYRVLASFLAAFVAVTYYFVSRPERSPDVYRSGNSIIVWHDRPDSPGILENVVFGASYSIVIMLAALVFWSFVSKLNRNT